MLTALNPAVAPPMQEVCDMVMRAREKTSLDSQKRHRLEEFMRTERGLFEGSVY